ncbi:MAG: DUF4446 family protein [Anaerolineae bacterium]
MDAILLPWVIASTILLFIAAYWIYTLERRYTALEARYEHLLTLDQEADAPTMPRLVQRLEAQEVQLAGVDASLTALEEIMPHMIQGCGTVRYNAFPNVGGEQSFSVALVDGCGNGVVITGLHGRDMRVYAKPLIQWRASHSLSSEEQEALGLARERIEHKGER